MLNQSMTALSFLELFVKAVNDHFWDNYIQNRHKACGIPQVRCSFMQIKAIPRCVKSRHRSALAALPYAFVREN